MTSTKKNIVASFFIAVLLWLGITGPGVYFRLYPLTHHVQDSAREQASMIVMANLRSSIRESVENRFPHLSEIKKQKLVKQRLDEVLHEEGSHAREAIDRVAQQISKGRAGTPRQYPYLLASDSFYYYQLTETIRSTGHISDQIRGSKYLNRRMLAPDGHWEPLNLHPYVGLWLDRVINRFVPGGMPLMAAVSFTPLVLMALAMIPFVRIGRQMRASAASIWTGGLVLSLAPIYLKRSTFGWYDNDPYNILFPLLILSLLFDGFNRRTPGQKTLAGLLTGLSLVLYTLFWHGWGLIIGIILAGAAATWLYRLAVGRIDTREPKGRYLYAGLFGVFLIGISLVFGFKEIFILTQEGWKALSNFLSPKLSLWPDMYIAVGELRKASWSRIVDLTGGTVVTAVAAWGLAVALSALLRPMILRVPFVAALLQARRKDDRTGPSPEAEQTIMLVVFLASTLIISLGAQRFILFCLVPLSLFFVKGADDLLKILRVIIMERFDLGLPARRIISAAACAGLVICLAAWPVMRAKDQIRSLLNPIYNNTWNQALTRLNSETPKNSVINSWWSPGHFITAVAKRAVVFDGATINTPASYWLANVFLEQDEQKALGLLRMLNASGNRAAELLTDSGLPLSEAAALIRHVTALNRGEAAVFLSGRLDKKLSSDLLAVTHADPPPSYFLLYNDLVDTSLQLAFCANWNFKEIEEIHKSPARQKQVPPADSKDYVHFLWQMIGGQPKYSGLIPLMGRKGNILVFEHNITVDLDTRSVHVDSPTYGTGRPQSLVFKDGAEFREHLQPSANLPYSVALIEKDGSFQAILMDRSLARSLIMRLFYFDGAGFDFISPVFSESDLTGRTRIKVFKIDWAGFQEKLAGAAGSRPEPGAARLITPVKTGDSCPACAQTRKKKELFKRLSSPGIPARQE